MYYTVYYTVLYCCFLRRYALHLSQNNKTKTMELWFQTLKSVKDVRSAGPRPRVKSQSLPVPAGVSGGGASDGTDWWDDVSHQAQRVAHVTAASMSIGATGEVRHIPRPRSSAKRLGDCMVPLLCRFIVFTKRNVSNRITEAFWPHGTVIVPHYCMNCSLLASSYGNRPYHAVTVLSSRSKSGGSPMDCAYS